MKLLYFSLLAILFSNFSFGQAGVITGPAGICSSSFATYTDTVPGGSWSVSMTAIATISSGGVLTPLTTGTTTISYTVGGTSATFPITIYPAPGSITGPSSVCAGSTIVLTDVTSGGIWSSSSVAVATIGAGSGVVTGVAPGVTTITYTLGSTGCMVTRAITVGAGVSPITGGTSVCVGDTLMEWDATSGGTWTSTTTAVATVSGGGVVTAISAGYTTISYTATSSCGTVSSYINVTVNPLPAVITGASSVCVGASISLSDVTTGGTWSSASTGILTINPVLGVVGGISAGVTTVSYTNVSSCSSVMSITVNPSLSPISGITTICLGASSVLSDAISGGTWSSSNPAVASVTGSTVTGMALGTAIISYTATGSCGTGTVTTTFAVTGTTIAGSISERSGVCNGGFDSLICNDSAVATYSWSPTIDLSCSTCSTTQILSAGTGVFNVTTTDIYGCVRNATYTIDANRIKGHVTFSGTVPSATDMKVWLIQFNSTDSSLIAQDSVVTCTPSTDATPYFEFNDKPAGNYMVKAKLLSSVAGSTGYIPTYGSSTPYWDSAATIVHSTTTDSLNINMIYGTVPSGPGFIGGLIVSGAGKATLGEVPDPNILVYLKDAANHILTYTYTDATGAFSFSGLGYGTYVIYPVAYKYITTPSTVITLSSTTASVTAVDFKRHTTLGTITPFVIGVGVNQLGLENAISIAPNPTTGNLNISWSNQTNQTANVVITDMLGREVYQTVLNINAANGNSQLSIANLNNGIYFINVRSGSINYSNKLQVNK